MDGVLWGGETLIKQAADNKSSRYHISPAAVTASGTRGTADTMYQNLNFLKNSQESYAVITSGDGVYKLDYNKVLELSY